jgi:hypothetical protein
MNTPATPADSPSLEQRLANLEAQNRRLRLAVGGIALGMILYAAWHTFFIGAVRATVVDARQVIVRDPAGRARIVLGTDDSLPPAFRAKHNPGLFLCDERGALRAQFYASEQLTGLDFGALWDVQAGGVGSFVPGRRPERKLADFGDIRLA